MNKNVNNAIESLRPIVSAITFVVTIILGWFVIPLTDEVKENADAISELKTNIAVQEVMIIGMNHKLDDIKGDLEKILDMIHDGHK